MKKTRFFYADWVFLFFKRKNITVFEGIVHVHHCAIMNRKVFVFCFLLFISFLWVLFCLFICLLYLLLLIFEEGCICLVGWLGVFFLVLFGWNEFDCFLFL